jgi:hypothetical protein
MKRIGIYEHWSESKEATMPKDMPADAKVEVATAGKAIELPSGHFIANAELTREGLDLHLTGPDGQTIVIEGYFALDPAPDLVSSDGGRLTPQLVDAFLPPERVGEYASSGQVANDASPAGRITEVVGEATIVRADGTRIPAEAGAPVFQGDVIETSKTGAVNIQFADNTTFAVSESARLSIDQFVYNAAEQSGSSFFSMLQGVFVYTSGIIGKSDPGSVNIETPVGSIGIRGTVVAGQILPAGQESKITILDGAIALTNGSGTQELSSSFQTVSLTSYQSQPVMTTMDAQSFSAIYEALAPVANDTFGNYSVLHPQLAKDSTDKPYNEEVLQETDTAQTEPAPVVATAEVIYYPKPPSTPETVAAPVEAVDTSVKSTSTILLHSSLLPPPTSTSLPPLPTTDSTSTSPPPITFSFAFSPEYRNHTSLTTADDGVRDFPKPGMVIGQIIASNLPSGATVTYMVAAREVDAVNYPAQHFSPPATPGTYSISSAPLHGIFAVDAATGRVFVNDPFAFFQELNPFGFYLTITATVSNGTSTQTFVHEPLVKIFDSTPLLSPLITNAMTVAGSLGADYIISTATGNATIGAKGGADVILGGSGNTVINIFDSSFRHVDGGLGEDKLVLGNTSNPNNFTLDLTARDSSVLRNMEWIDLAASTGNNGNHVRLNVEDVFMMTDGRNRLEIMEGISSAIGASVEIVSDATGAFTQVASAGDVVTYEGNYNGSTVTLVIHNVTTTNATGGITVIHNSAM